MTASDRASPLVRAVQDDDERWQAFAHPLNPRSEIHGVSLSELAGMKRVGVHLARIPPGKEAFIYHSHTCEEEFVFILSGRAIAEIGGEEHEVGAGDFMGFRAPSVPHHLRNPFDDPVVYLMGGERTEVEIADFPRLGKRIVRTGSDAYLVDHADMHPFWRGNDESEDDAAEGPEP